MNKRKITNKKINKRKYRKKSLKKSLKRKNSKRIFKQKGGENFKIINSIIRRKHEKQYTREEIKELIKQKKLTLNTRLLQKGEIKNLGDILEFKTLYLSSFGQIGGAQDAAAGREIAHIPDWDGNITPVIKKRIETIVRHYIDTGSNLGSQSGREIGMDGEWVGFDINFQKVFESGREDLPSGDAVYERIWNEQNEGYLTSYHGVPSIEVLNSILNEGRLLFPGEYLKNGTQIRQLNPIDGGETPGIFTSPTIDYAGLKSYARPILISCGGPEKREYMSIVIECRQKKEGLEKGQETQGIQLGGEIVSFSRHYPEMFERIVHNIPDSRKETTVGGRPVLEYKVSRAIECLSPPCPAEAVVPVKVYFRYYREDDDKYWCPQDYRFDIRYTEREPGQPLPGGWQCGSRVPVYDGWHNPDAGNYIEVDGFPLPPDITLNHKSFEKALLLSRLQRNTTGIGIIRRNGGQPPVYSLMTGQLETVTQNQQIPEGEIVKIWKKEDRDARSARPRVESSAREDRPREVTMRTWFAHVEIPTGSPPNYRGITYQLEQIDQQGITEPEYYKFEIVNRLQHNIQIFYESGGSYKPFRNILQGDNTEFKAATATNSWTFKIVSPSGLSDFCEGLGIPGDIDLNKKIRLTIRESKPREVQIRNEEEEDEDDVDEDDDEEEDDVDEDDDEEEEGGSEVDEWEVQRRERRGEKAGGAAGGRAGALTEWDLRWGYGQVGNKVLVFSKTVGVWSPATVKEYNPETDQFQVSYKIPGPGGREKTRRQTLVRGELIEALQKRAQYDARRRQKHAVGDIRSLYELRGGETVFVGKDLRPAEFIRIIDGEYASVSYGPRTATMVKIENLSSSPGRHVPFRR